MVPPAKAGGSSSRRGSQEQGSNENLSSKKDIWTLVKEEKEREKKNESTTIESPLDAQLGYIEKEGIDTEAAIDSLLFFVGQRNAGKTSLVLRFLDRDEAPTPTTALEYTFGRRTRGMNGTKDVVHIWELAGGDNLADLINFPITESNIHNVTMVIVVDLSQPSEALRTVEHFMTKINARISQILDGLEKRGSKRPKALKAHAMKRFGLDHPDKDFVRLCPLPIVIIGSKYDVFRDLESDRRKLFCKALRFMAHVNGASLVFTSHRDENAIARCRQVLNFFAFKGNPLKSVNFDHNRPIAVMGGMDSLSQIGPPPSMATGDNLPAKLAQVSDTQWKQEFEKYFPPTQEEKKQVVDMIDFSKYSEPTMDSLRAQKDEELERIRRVNERKAKDKDFLAAFAGLGVTGSSKQGAGKAYSRAKYPLFSRQQRIPIHT